MIHFRVVGRPVPQPRPKITTIPYARAYVPSKHAIHKWRDDVTCAFLKSKHPKQSGPLSVRIELDLKRTKSCKSSPCWDVRGGGYGGDVDNFAKAILDALNGHAWDDDCQVVSLRVMKRLASKEGEPGASISIRSLANG